METYSVIRTLAGGNGEHLAGFAKRYASGQWVFQPALGTGRKSTKKRYRTLDACIPKWAGGVDGTRSEPYNSAS